MSPLSKLYIFKRPNGIWYILQKSDGKTRWKTTGCTEKSEALKKLTEFKGITKDKPTPNRLSEFIRDFLSYARTTYAKASIDIFLVALRNLQAITGDCKITAISFKHVDLYKATRLRAVSPVSVNVELRSLRTIFNIAQRWNQIEANPFVKVQLVRIPEIMPAFFTKEDFLKFLDAVGNHRLRDVFVFAILTGLRRGEILNLKWTDIDLDRKIAQIQSSVTYRVKAGKRRVIPLSDQAVKLLENRQVSARCEYVFNYRGLKINGNYVTQRLKKFLRKTGLDQRLHFHSLRHSHATWLVMNRVSIYEVKELLGHSSVTTTSRYSHLVSSELHDAVNRIDVGME